MKKITLLSVVMLCIIGLYGCGCRHEWNEATCTEPKTCTECEEIEGEALGHTWEKATCTEPKTCSTCKETQGYALKHKWKDATFDSPKTCTRCDLTEGEPIDINEFEDLLSETPAYVSSTRYIEQSEYKSLYPDILGAVVKNNSGKPIKNALVAFAAWDSNGFPIKIIGDLSFDGGNYILYCNYADINLVDGDSTSTSTGLPISEDTADIDTFKAIVVEYTDFDGNTWENPYFTAWCDLYEDKPL